MARTGAALAVLGALALIGLAAAGAEATPAPPGPKPPGPLPPPPGGLPPFAETGGAAWLRALPARENVQAREAAMLAAVRAGYCHTIEWVRVDCSRAGHDAHFFTTADAIRIGTDAAAVRPCVSAIGAQRIADELGAVLNTSRTSDLAYAQAVIKLAPQDQGPGSSTSMAAMIAHSEAVDRALKGRAGFCRDVGKDVVLSPKMVDAEGRYRGRLINFGWHSDTAPNRSPAGAHVWQKVAAGHPDSFADDSMTLCVVAAVMVVDGVKRDFVEIAQHPELHVLVSDEGPLPMTRYPT